MPTNSNVDQTWLKAGNVFCKSSLVARTRILRVTMDHAHGTIRRHCRAGLISQTRALKARNRRSSRCRRGSGARRGRGSRCTGSGND